MQTLDDIEVYLEGVMVNATNGLLRFAWSAMVQLTPSVEVNRLVQRIEKRRRYSQFTEMIVFLSDESELTLVCGDS